jgi:exonuclease III
VRSIDSRPRRKPGGRTQNVPVHHWDCYRRRFERDRGLKIDFVLATPLLADRATGAFIDHEERAAKGTSDQAPVVVDRH